MVRVWHYNDVHNNWPKAFFKIMKKPLLVEKKRMLHMKDQLICMGMEKMIRYWKLVICDFETLTKFSEINIPENVVDLRVVCQTVL